MTTAGRFIIFLIVLFLFACEKETSNETLIFDFRRSLYNYDLCQLELQGTIESLVLPADEVGMVYSYENEQPTLSDETLVLNGSDENIFAALDDYLFSQVLYWRIYVIADGQTSFSETFQFREDYRTKDIISLPGFYDCISNERNVLIDLDNVCASEVQVCMSTQQSTTCEEIIIIDQQELDIEVPDGIIEIEISVLTGPNADNVVFNTVILVSDRNIIELVDEVDMPIAVAESTGFRYGDYYYVCGGYTTSHTDLTSDFWRYDFLNEEWTQLPDYPAGPRALMMSTVVGDIAYIGSGGNGELQDCSTKFYSYNLITNEWTRLADLFVDGAGGLCFEINDQIYVTNLARCSSRPDGRIYRYDIASDSWSIIGSIPSQFRFLNSRNMAVVVDEAAYVVRALEESVQVMLYDSFQDSWSFVSNSPFSCNDGVAFTDNNSLFITSGRGMDGVFELDLRTFESSFHCTSNQDLRSEAVGTIYNGRAYIFGGLVHDLDPTIYTDALSSVYSFEL